MALRFASRRLAVTLALLPLWPACSGAQDDELVIGGPDAGPEQSPTEDVMLTAAADAELTPWRTVMITGTGPAQGTLIVTSPERGVEERSLGSTGDFCIDVHLRDGENLIKLEAVSAGGAYSAPVLVTVTREGEPPEIADEPSESVVDRTDGASYYSNADGGTEGGVKLIEGDWSDLVDGDTTDLLKFEGGALHNEAVAYKLAERVRVYGFDITAPPIDGPGCGPDAFEVYLSDTTDPEMAFDGIAWIKVADVDTDDRLREGGTYHLPANFSVNARYFAIRGTNASCEPWIYYNQYGLREVRVLAVEETAGEPPANPTPSCASAAGM